MAIEFWYLIGAALVFFMKATELLCFNLPLVQVPLSWEWHGCTLSYLPIGMLREHYEH
ncbi:MAG: hypothetical protein IJ247_05725 [Bacilli bacterium]|nr:hypothetical protein [Bacilli bacterium]